MNNEIRMALDVEFRADDEGVRVTGHAAVFDQEANIGGMFREKFAPGAFADTLERGDDVVFLINHGGLPLARTRSGTLKLSEDKRGLLIDTRLEASDPDVASIVPKMQRGDLDKMSIAFRSLTEEWDESDENEIPLRTIQQAGLFDVSIVTTPAYEGTDIGLRFLEAYRATLRPSAAIASRARIKSRLATI